MKNRLLELRHIASIYNIPQSLYAIPCCLYSHKISIDELRKEKLIVV